MIASFQKFQPLLSIGKVANASGRFGGDVQCGSTLLLVLTRYNRRTPKYTTSLTSL